MSACGSGFVGQSVQCARACVCVMFGSAPVWQVVGVCVHMVM